MIIADGSRKDKGDRTLDLWVPEESGRVAPEIVQRLSPAVRPAMTTLDRIETGTQALVQHVGRPITEALMVAPLAESSGVCRKSASGM